jgi:lipopolysaccharide/colanic/teichoic acid biosynthesis glycosyltransferase
MSLVGPRPLMMQYLTRYSPEQAKRHDVKPGITGLAQVNGRNAISWEQKFQNDIFYVANQSFFLDIKILWKTFMKVINRKDINFNSKITIEEFMG